MAAFLVDDESVRWGRSDYATSSCAAVRAVLSKSVRPFTHYDALAGHLEGLRLKAPAWNGPGL